MIADRTSRKQVDRNHVLASGLPDKYLDACEAYRVPGSAAESKAIMHLSISKSSIVLLSRLRLGAWSPSKPISLSSGLGSFFS